MTNSMTRSETQTFTPVEGIETIIGYSENNHAFLKQLIKARVSSESSYERILLNSGSDLAKFYIRMEGVLFNLASHTSPDYKGGCWSINEHGLYILNAPSERFTVNGFACEYVLTDKEFSLYLNVMFYCYCADVEKSSIVRDFCAFMYHYCSVYYREQDGNTFNVTAIYSLLD